MLSGGTDQRVIRRALAALHQQEQARDLESLLGYFAGIVLGKELAA